MIRLHLEFFVLTDPETLAQYVTERISNEITTTANNPPQQSPNQPHQPLPGNIRIIPKIIKKKNQTK